MTRDTEQKLIAYSLLLVAGITVVGWFGWVATSVRLAWLYSLFVLGSFVLIAGSIFLGVAGVFVIERVERDWELLARTVALAMVTGVFAATVYLFIWGADATLLLAGTVIALLAIWVVVPLAIGGLTVASSDQSMVGILLGWPPANVLALGLFTAPAPNGIDFAHYNAAVLAEPLRSVVFLAIVFTITIGPVLFGRLIDRYMVVPAVLPE